MAMEGSGRLATPASPASPSTPNSPVSEVLRLLGNTQCFDCSADCAADPWVSVSHGTVICLECAGVHRSLGVQVSFVRSLRLDTIKASEHKVLLLGGNARLRSFLEEPAQNVLRHVWLALPLEVRYHTPAADLYRRRLKAEAEGTELPGDLRRVTLPRPSLVGPRPSMRPEQRPACGSVAWTADKAAPQCELCRTHFTLLERRHHCRNCGRCVCNSCSPPEGMRPLPQLGYSNPCRQCKVCSPPAARVIQGLDNGEPNASAVKRWVRDRMSYPARPTSRAGLGEQ